MAADTLDIAPHRSDLIVQGAIAHPRRASVLALVTATVTVILLAADAHLGAASAALGRSSVGWLAVALAAEVVSVVAYAVAYRRTMWDFAHQGMSGRRSLRLTLAGFSGYAMLGGFRVDRTLLGDADPRDVRRGVLALGIVETAVLGVGALVTATIVIVGGDHISGTMTWPWIAAVPVVLGALATPPARRFRRLVVASLAHPRTLAAVAAYYAADLACAAAAAHAVGVDIAPGPLIIAYSSGFLLTRRALPLGSAGSVELLLALSYTWVGQAWAPSVAAVVIYRVFNLVLLALAALWVNTATASQEREEECPQRRPSPPSASPSRPRTCSARARSSSSTTSGTRSSRTGTRRCRPSRTRTMS